MAAEVGPITLLATGQTAAHGKARPGVGNVIMNLVMSHAAVVIDPCWA